MSLIALSLLTMLSAAPLDRARQPAPAPEARWALPNIRQLKIQGIDVFLVERHDLPLVEMQLTWNLGAVLDPAGKEGMHGICVGLVGEGTKQLDKAALEDRKADLGLTLNVGAGRETASLSLAVVKDRLAPALDLATEVLTNPGLRDADLQRLRGTAKAAVLQQRGNADGVGDRVAPVVLWGRGHPYGKVVTPTSLDAITRDDCARIAAQLKPDGAQLVVVGDVTEAELATMLDTRTAAWRGKAPAKPRVGPPKQPKGTIFFVDVPGAQQSKVMLGKPGPSRTAEDYYATTVMSQVFGQGLPSRLVQNLREKNGFTYGASAAFQYARSGSQLVIQSSIRTDATGKALREIAAELKGMTDRPPSNDEVTREREGGIRALPARFSTGGATLGSVGMLTFYGLPLDTWSKMPAQLGAVDVDQVRRAVAERLTNGDFKLIIVGDKTAVLPELEALAKEGVFGKDGLVVLDADGNLM